MRSYVFTVFVVAWWTSRMTANQAQRCQQIVWNQRSLVLGNTASKRVVLSKSDILHDRYAFLHHSFSPLTWADVNDALASDEAGNRPGLSGTAAGIRTESLQFLRSPYVS